MLSARSPLSVRDENTLSSQINNMALDKENTVRRRKTVKLTFHLFNVQICFYFKFTVFLT